MYIQCLTCTIIIYLVIFEGLSYILWKVSLYFVDHQLNKLFCTASFQRLKFCAQESYSEIHKLYAPRKLLCIQPLLFTLSYQ